MRRFSFTRFPGAVPTLFIIITITFFLMRAAPGGPFDQEQALAPEIKANLQRAYGLDQPVWTQYGRYLKSLLHGDFGPSFKYKDFTVTELIGQGFPVTLQLGVMAIALALLLGVPLGTFAALHHNSAADTATMSLVVTGIRHSLICSSTLPRFAIRRVSSLVAGRGLGERLAAPSCAPRYRLGVAALGLYRAPDTRQHAGNSAQPLHLNRFRQGTTCSQRDYSPCAEARARSRRELPRSRRSVDSDWIFGGRVHRGAARHRTISGARGDQTRVPARARHGDHLLGVTHRHGTACRSSLRLARPTREVIAK